MSADEFELPTQLWGAMASVIKSHSPYKITGRATEAEGLKGLVITLHCDDQREGQYKVRYLVLPGQSAPIQLPAAGR